MRRNVTLAFVSFRGPTYQNIVLNSTRTNIDCDRDLGHVAPYVLYGDLFFPHTKSQTTRPSARVQGCANFNKMTTVFVSKKLNFYSLKDYTNIFVSRESRPYHSKKCRIIWHHSSKSSWQSPSLSSAFTSRSKSVVVIAEAVELILPLLSTGSNRNALDIAFRSSSTVNVPLLSKS